MSVENLNSPLPVWFDPVGLEVRLRQTVDKYSVILEGPSGERLTIFKRLDRVGGMFQVNWSMVFPHDAYLKGKIFLRLEDVEEAFRLDLPSEARWPSSMGGGLYYRDDHYLIIPDIRSRSILSTSFSLVVTGEIQEAVKEMLEISRKSGV